MTMVRAERSGFRMLQGQVIFLFFKKPRPTLGSIQPSFQWAPGFFSDYERSEREADYSPTSSADVELYLYSPYTPVWCGVGDCYFYVSIRTEILLLCVLWPEMYASCTLSSAQGPQFALNALPRHFFSCLSLILSFPATKRMARSIDWAWWYPSCLPPGCGTFSWWFRMGLDDALLEV